MASASPVVLLGLSPGDPNSFSRPNECLVTNIRIELDIDFSSTSLKGLVDLTIERKVPLAEKVILDTRDLQVTSVIDNAVGQPLPYTMGCSVGTFGAPLEITLPKTGINFDIRVHYETSPTSSALQWLKPEQTVGKVFPYLLSHCQAIHARSMLPCQDTPSVKTPYSAKITAPKELVVLMSAVRLTELDEQLFELNDATKRTKTFHFKQKIPIPSYLFAIVAAALEGRRIGPRSHVWSEKEVVEKAAYEFEETESMLLAAESFLGPYVWGVYDLLVMPPSFPYGGMENPCLTFVTPTLLAGDRSLATVVQHEIAHSWTGNLVTNRNWEHFWLNEGFTVFVERKISSRINGDDENRRHFEALGGWKQLEYSVSTLGVDHPLSRLVVDLRGVDPDDAFSSVPYEKGHTLLFYLEQLLGGKKAFEGFLCAYIDQFRFKSIDTDIFKDFLYKHFTSQSAILDTVDWEKWLHGPGMPPVMPDYNASMADQCLALCQKWTQDGDEAEFKADDLGNFSSAQVIEFLALLLQQEKSLSCSKLSKMTDLYRFKENQNAEIKFRWLRLGLINHWMDVVDLALDFVTQQGRMKFVRPIYRDLYAWESTRELAIKTFLANRFRMMHVAAYTVSKDLHLDECAK